MAYELPELPYAYDAPKEGDKHPFAAKVEVAGCPWNKDHRLARIAIKGREIAHDKRRGSRAIVLPPVGHHRIPQQITSESVERHDVRVVGDHEQATAPVHDHLVAVLDRRFRLVDMALTPLDIHIEQDAVVPDRPAHTATGDSYGPP